MAKVKAFDTSTIRSSLEENPRVTKVLIPSHCTDKIKTTMVLFRERPGQETTSNPTKKVADSTQSTVIECAHLDHPVSTFDSVRKCTSLDIVQNTPENFHAGKICFHFDRWKELTSDRNILKTVLGYKLDLLQCPMQAKLPHQIRFSPEEVIVVDTEIQKLLDKNVIERANRVENDFISNIFTTKKRDGTYRLILNLQTLNKDIEDLKDAYYSVPIYSTNRKFLKFMWKDQCFQYTCLPNGLSSAPRVFTKLLKPVFSTLRKQAFENVPYIDDILLLGDSDEHCAQNVRSTSTLLDSLGFTIHPTKSVFVPVQEIAFLGFLINSKKMSVSLLQEKANEIKNLGSKLIIKHEVQLIGKMVAASPAVQHAPLRYRNLEIFKDTMLRQNRGNFNKKVLLTVGSIQDISW